MFDVFLVVVFGIVCLVFGYLIALRGIQKHYDVDPNGLIDVLKNATIKASKNADIQCINVIPELHDGTVFLYSEDTGVYISKGMDIPDAIANACIRFENCDFNVKL